VLPATRVQPVRTGEGACDPRTKQQFYTIRRGSRTSQTGSAQNLALACQLVEDPKSAPPRSRRRFRPGPPRRDARYGRGCRTGRANGPPRPACARPPGVFDVGAGFPGSSTAFFTERFGLADGQAARDGVPSQPDLFRVARETKEGARVAHRQTSRGDFVLQLLGQLEQP